MRALLASCVIVCVAPDAFAGEEVLVFDGEVPTDDDSRFFQIPFEVPAGVVEIEVRHDDLSEANILDWGLFDPVRFRGWGGGNVEPAVVGIDAASRSYLPGPLPAGTWRVRVGEAKIDEEPARYHVEVILRDEPTLKPQPERTPYSPALPLASGGRWWAGDLHVHSRESGDARPTLEEIAVLARERGLDFVELSDHNTTSQLDFIADAQARHPDLLFLPGVEYTTYAGHANGIGATQWVEHEIDFPEGDIQAAAAAFAEQGAVFSMNHPTLDLFDLCIGCAWRWGLDPARIDAMEITTGGWSESGWLLAPPSIEMWDALCSEGHRIVPVGGSDDHRAGQDLSSFGSPIGDPTTMVWAEELSVEAIVEGIRKGRTVVKLQGPDDPMVELSSSVPPVDGTITAARTTFEIVATGGGDRLLVQRNGLQIEGVQIDDDPFVHEIEVEAPASGEDFYRAVAVVDGTIRTVTANLWLRTGGEPDLDGGMERDAGAGPDAAPPEEDAGGGGCSVGAVQGAPSSAPPALFLVACLIVRPRKRVLGSG
ncbi:MAG: CehA/McbA family metallohydrolase [Deltaproteobacteria bacterium]|nr:CehA/McbA family metallohydrolase [Deltaproteobacteria bacterium]